MIRGFHGMLAKRSDICISCLAKFSSSFPHFRLKIILKQLFPSCSVNIARSHNRGPRLWLLILLNVYLDFVSVNIQQYLLRFRRIVKYWYLHGRYRYLHGRYRYLRGPRPLPVGLSIPTGSISIPTGLISIPRGRHRYLRVDIDT